MSHPQNTIFEENKKELEMPSLNQLYWLAEYLLKDEVLQKHFQLPDSITETKIKIEKISLDEYDYIKMLIYRSKRTKLNLKLIQLKFKPKV